MFKVIVLACSVMNPEQCWEYHDTRGPYERYEQCTTRAYEMGNMIREVHEGSLQPVKYKCEQLKGQQL